ncbi:glucokinase [Synechococcus sp. PCC 7336]|uniref:glucokinase n=1 Tax=Synechococcus sp. PCC 7336 TaxID=195250 RepID=UPI000344926D|nr:glucokinase [Synechococcus sp. PCC 7336]
MAIVLSGDIGGTKTILRLSPADSNPALPGTNLYRQRFPSADYPDLVPMVQQFFTEAAQHLPESEVEQLDRLSAACFAIAGPVVDNTSQLTNLSWQLDGDRLAQELNIARVELLNDFAAIGYGVTALPDSDLAQLQAGTPASEAPIGVLGAGTGLGQTYLTWQGDGYRVHPSEGGHAGFAPRTERQQELLRYLWERHGRVSVERVVSGQGIVSIYQFLRDRRSTPAAETEAGKAVAEAVRAWERDRSGDAGAAIGEAALEGSDPLSVETLQLFVSAYGAEAGDLALKLLPAGGLYVAGGIATKILPLLQQGEFMEAFLDKGRLTPVLKTFPVKVVLNPKVGSIGAALRATQLARRG